MRTIHGITVKILKTRTVTLCLYYYRKQAGSEANV